MAEIQPFHDHFVSRDPAVMNLYDRLLSLVWTFGRLVEDPRKTSIPLNPKSALAGVETRRDCIPLNFKSDHKIKRPR